MLPLPPFSAAFLYYQPHIFHMSAMLVAGRDYVNSRGNDAAMTENICEFDNVLFDTVKGACKQMS